jgi:hypothetical protein
VLSEAAKQGLLGVVKYVAEAPEDLRPPVTPKLKKGPLHWAAERVRRG